MLPHPWAGRSSPRGARRSEPPGLPQRPHGARRRRAHLHPRSRRAGCATTPSGLGRQRERPVGALVELRRRRDLRVPARHRHGRERRRVRAPGGYNGYGYDSMGFGTPLVAPDGEYAVLPGLNGGPALVELATGKVLIDQPEGPGNFTWSPDGRWLFQYDERGVAEAVSTADGHVVELVAGAAGHDLGHRACSRSADGRALTRARGAASTCASRRSLLREVRSQSLDAAARPGAPRRGAARRTCRRARRGRTARARLGRAGCVLASVALAIAIVGAIVVLSGGDSSDDVGSPTTAPTQTTRRPRRVTTTPAADRHRTSRRSPGRCWARRPAGSRCTRSAGRTWSVSSSTPAPSPLPAARLRSAGSYTSAWWSGTAGWSSAGTRGVRAAGRHPERAATSSTASTSIRPSPPVGC